MSSGSERGNQFANLLRGEAGKGSSTRRVIKQDILRTYKYAPGSTLRKVVACWRSLGVHAVVVFRFGQWLRRQPLLLRLFLTPIYLLQYHRMRTRWGIEIPRKAEIGEGLYIGHFGGITISPASRIGTNATISQQVVIGVSGEGEARGSPVIGDNVYIGSGAKVLGKIRLGNNAVVYKDIPDNAVVVLDPGFKIISYKGNIPVKDPRVPPSTDTVSTAAPQHSHTAGVPTHSRG